MEVWALHWPEAHCPSTVAPSEDRASHSFLVMQVPVRSLLALGVHESCLKLRMLKIPNSPGGKKGSQSDVIRLTWYCTVLSPNLFDRFLNYVHVHVYKLSHIFYPFPLDPHSGLKYNSKFIQPPILIPLFGNPPNPSVRTLSMDGP